MANIGYRSFNGTSDVVDLNLGNIAGVSSLDCWIFAGRIFGTTGGEIISSPGYDPLDLYATFDGVVGFPTVRLFDGVGDSSADTPTGPTWQASDGFVIFAVRRVASTAVRWSKAVYSGTWGTFTHTNGQTVFTNRPYASSGILIVANQVALHCDLALLARTTSSSDANIATLTTDLTSWTSLPNLTNLWRFDGASVVDLVGTATQNAITGTTVTANGFPLDTGSAPTAIDVPALIVPTAAVVRSYYW